VPRTVKTIAVLAVAFALIVPGLVQAKNDRAPRQAFVRLLRHIDVADLGLTRPSGLAYVPGARALIVVDAGGATHLVGVAEDDLGPVALPATPASPASVTFDAAGAELIVIDANAAVNEAPAPNGRPSGPAVKGRAPAPQTVTGTATSGDQLLVGDGTGFVALPSDGNRGSRRVDLARLGEPLIGMAVDPQSGNIYTLGSRTSTL
jgi:hypothetical protein